MGPTDNRWQFAYLSTETDSPALLTIRLIHMGVTVPQYFLSKTKSLETNPLHTYYAHYFDFVFLI